MSQVKKLSVATVFGKIKLSELMNLPDQRQEVMRVFGVATGTKDVPTQYGISTGLLGTFRAINPVTGETNDSSVLYLPDIALVPIRVKLAMPGTQGVEFAYSIFASYVAEKEGFKAGGSPYEYTFEHVMQPEGANPLDRIAAKIASQAQAALPAPVTATEPTPEPTPEIVGKRGRK